MIAGLAPFATDGIGVATLAAGSVLVAWSPWRRHFQVWLLAASALMLATWSGPAALVTLAVILVPPYLLIRRRWGLGEAAPRWPSRAMIAWLIVVFAVLRGYPGFELLRPSAAVAVIGLSFILLRQIHLLLDAPRLGELPLTPWSYASYILAFWTLLAGPVQRYPDFVAGIGRIGPPRSLEAALPLLHRVINGLLKAFVVAPLFLQPGNIVELTRPGIGALDVATVFYSYPIYLYLNFSGYSDVAVAVAGLCGMDSMPENFRRPYLARNIMEFWNRWHMSVSFWIRDYFFTPLNLTVHRRVARRFQGVALIGVVMLTFLTIGVWHGTTLGFAVLGLMHGAAVVTAVLWGKLVKRLLGNAGRKRYEANRAIAIAAGALTFHFVCLTLLLFNNPMDSILSTAAALLR